MIDESFIEKIEQMAKVERFEIGGIEYASKGLVKINQPMAAELKINSLTALLDYIEKEMEDAPHILHIVDHANVSLLGRLTTPYRTRENFVRAECHKYDFQYGNSYSVDKFIIAMQAQFVQDETTAKILKLVGNLTSQTEVQTKDDGVTQRVEARTGLAKVENVSVPNPVCLAPFRTFIELDQPHSNFVLRLDSNQRCALYEADGGAWKITAMKGIREFLDNGLKSIGKADQVTIIY